MYQKLFWFIALLLHTSVKQMILYRFIFSKKPPSHFIFSNVWCICVVSKFLGFYPLKRIGHSELIPTSKWQFILTYILSCTVVFAMSVTTALLYFTEISSECWIKSIIASYSQAEVSQGIFFSVEIIIRIILIPYHFWYWSSLRKGFSTLQDNFNGIELVYPDHSIKLSIIAFDKVPTFSQFRSKIMIRLMCIIPGILILIGVGIQSIGINTAHFNLLSDTTCSLAASDIKPYFIPINVCFEIVRRMYFAIHWYYIYVIYVDISHLFLAWSDSILNEKYLLRSAFLLHSETFIKMLTNFNKIISPFNFMTVFSSLFICIFDGFDFIYISIQFFKNDEISTEFLVLILGEVVDLIGWIVLLAIICNLSEGVAKQAKSIRNKIIDRPSELTYTTGQDNSNYICTLLDEFKGFNANGFFTLNHSLLCGMFVNFLTFLVIVVDIALSWK